MQDERSAQQENQFLLGVASIAVALAALGAIRDVNNDAASHISQPTFARAFDFGPAPSWAMSSGAALAAKAAMGSLSTPIPFFPDTPDREGRHSLAPRPVFGPPTRAMINELLKGTPWEWMESKAQSIALKVFKGAIRFVKPRAQAPARPMGAPNSFFEFGSGLAPAFNEASGVVFTPLEHEVGDAGAAGILRRLIAEHDHAHPAGWDLLVARVAAAREEGGEKGMATVANAVINEVPYVDNTGGVYFSPKRFFERGGAVCKDFANVTYLLLRDAGFPVDKMRIAALAVSAGSSYPAGHVVLLVKVDDVAEPYALDLPTGTSFAQDLKNTGETYQARLARVKKDGLALREPNMALGNMVPLSRFNSTWYGGARGLLAVSNEHGSRWFTTSKPDFSNYELLWTALDGSARAYKGPDGVWVHSFVQSAHGSYWLHRRIGDQQVEQEHQLADRNSGRTKPESTPTSTG